VIWRSRNEGHSIVDHRLVSVLNAPKLKTDTVNKGRGRTPGDKSIVAIGKGLDLKGHGGLHSWVLSPYLGHGYITYLSYHPSTFLVTLFRAVQVGSEPNRV